MTVGPLFWKLLTAACILWYLLVTVYVAIRGAADIRDMLRNLARRDRAGGSRPT